MGDTLRDTPMDFLYTRELFDSAPLRVEFMGDPLRSLNVATHRGMRLEKGEIIR